MARFPSATQSVIVNRLEDLVESLTLVLHLCSVLLCSVVSSDKFIFCSAVCAILQTFRLRRLTGVSFAFANSVGGGDSVTIRLY